MNTVGIPRSVRHHGAKGKTLQPTLDVGTRVHVGHARNPGIIVQVRTKKKYARRYVVCEWGDICEWRRRDQFTL